jgi:hypothetical protein
MVSFPYTQIAFSKPDSSPEINKGYSSNVKLKKELTWMRFVSGSQAWVGSILKIFLKIFLNPCEELKQSGLECDNFKAWPISGALKYHFWLNGSSLRVIEVI